MASNFWNRGDEVQVQGNTDRIADLVDFTNPDLRTIELTEGRIAFEEKSSDTLTVSGWYTIAELPSGGFDNTLSHFSAVLGNGAISLSVGLYTNTAPKTTETSTIKFTNSSASVGVSNRVQKKARLAKSDSITSSGAKIQVYIDVSTLPLPLQTGMFWNIGRPEPGQKAWSLVTPYLDNTPTLPDGITTATFIEAGAEFPLSLPSSPSVIGWKFTNNDQVYLRITWPEEPKQGTGLDVSTFPTNTRFWSAAGASGSDINDAVVSNFSIQGKEITCILNKVGISTNFVNNTACFLQVAGTTGKFTITG